MRSTIRLLPLLLFGWISITLVPGAIAQSLLPIGTIQGKTNESPYNGQTVTFRGVVTGQYEDINTRGIVYYTIFVQELPETGDGDAVTSDGIAVFLGRQQPFTAIGDQVVVKGRVTEFYNFTEIDDQDLAITIEQRGVALPPPVAISPPADMSDQAAYFEAVEGMRVAFEGPVTVAGPTHEGCGFAVLDESYSSNLPVIRQAEDDTVGRVVPVLYPSDVDCNDIHQVKTGDRLSGLSGVVVYNFDQFKIVLDSTLPVTVEPTELAPLLIMPQLGAEQISIVTINAEDYFDTNRDTADDGEPVLTDEELSTRQVKLTHVLTNLLACPTIIGFQEIEKASLLDALADELAGSCGFAYEVSHLESADSRGIDNALLSDASRVSVQSVALRQACSPVPTGIEDESIACESGQEPLFGRPPLQVEVTIDGKPFTFFINHFKSKRGGEIETELERIQQAVYLNELAAEILTSDANANIIALGDLNDTELSPVMLLLTDPGQGGNFVNILSAVPRSQRYTYNFGGVSELLDVILLSPSLAVEANASFILHVNTDYPVAWRLDAMPERITYRFSDHDIPVLILGEASPTPAPTIPASPKPHPQSIPSPAPTVSPATVPAPTVTPLPASADNRTESSAASATGRSPAMNVAMLLAVGTVFLAVLGLVWYRRDR